MLEDRLEGWTQVLKSPTGQFQRVSSVLEEVTRWSETSLSAVHLSSLTLLVTDLLRGGQGPSQSLLAELHRDYVEAPGWVCLEALHRNLLRVYRSKT